MNTTIDNRRSFIYLLIISIAYILTNFHRASLSVLAPFLEESMNVTIGQIGLLGSILFYIYGFFQLPLGFLSDKYGGKIIIQVSAFLLIIGSLIFAVADDFKSLLIGRIVISIGISGFYIPSMNLIRQWFDVRFYGFYLGLYLSLGYVGSLFASIPLDFLLNKYSIKSIYYVLTLVALITAIGSFFLKENKIEPSKNKKKGKGFTKEFSIFLLAICVYSLIFNGARQAFQAVWANIYYIEVFGFTSLMASLMLMIFNIGGIVFSPIVGRIADRKGNYQVLMAVTFSLAIFWLVIGFTPVSSPYLLIAIFALILGALNSTGMQNVFTMVGEYTADDIRSSSAAIINSVSYFGSAIFSQVMGATFNGVEMNHSVFLKVYIAFSLLLLFSLLPVYFGKKYIDKKNRQLD